MINEIENQKEQKSRNIRRKRREKKEDRINSDNKLKSWFFFFRCFMSHFIYVEDFYLL